MVNVLLLKTNLNQTLTIPQLYHALSSSKFNSYPQFYDLSEENVLIRLNLNH